MSDELKKMISESLKNAEKNRHEKRDTPKSKPQDVKAYTYIKRLIDNAPVGNTSFNMLDKMLSETFEREESSQNVPTGYMAIFNMSMDHYMHCVLNGQQTSWKNATSVYRIERIALVPVDDVFDKPEDVAFRLSIAHSENPTMCVFTEKDGQPILASSVDDMKKKLGHDVVSVYRLVPKTG